MSLLGHLCKTLSIINAYAKEYEEEWRKYSVEITEEDLQKDNINYDIDDNVESDNTEVGGQTAWYSNYEHPDKKIS